MVFDPVEHEEKRMRFLRTLYEIEQEDVAGKPDEDVRHERVIGQRAGLTEKQWDRISSELLEDDLIDGQGAGGLVCYLTRRGKELVEKDLYEKSSLGRRRKAIELAKEGGIYIGKNTAITLGGAIISIIASLGVFAAFKEQIVHWIRRQLGL